VVGRIAKHGLAATDQHGYVLDPDVETIQQLLGAGVLLELDVRVGVAVAGEELLDAKGVAGVTRPDDHDVPESLGNQLHAAEDERPHQDLAQLAVGLDERHQLMAIELDHGAGFTRAHADQPAAAGQQAHLARELPPSEDGHELFGVAGPPHELEAAGGDDDLTP
jgi:hypothetical protein